MSGEKNDSVPLQERAGMQMLAHASKEGYAVIEFRESEDGTLRLLDVTDHYRSLEQQVNEEDPKPSYIDD